MILRHFVEAHAGGTLHGTPMGTINHAGIKRRVQFAARQIGGRSTSLVEKLLQRTG